MAHPRIYIKLCVPIQCMGTKSSNLPTVTIPSVNYHLLQACNMSCGHCYAANLSRKSLGPEKAVEIVRQLADAGFEKITFAGGEPMMYPGLAETIREAKGSGMTTSIVTNGSRITEDWLESMHGCLDWVALSIDSVKPRTNVMSGRATSLDPMTAEVYLRTARSIKLHGIRLKINTVVTLYNHEEDMSGFIRAAGPERWKIMQELTVAGQNDESVRRFQVTVDQFKVYVKRCRWVEQEGIVVIPEDNDMMTGSYAMVDPLGRFFDNVDGRYSYSRPILKVGVVDALKDVRIDIDRFEKRGGFYDWV